ncbi:hypothetical protein Sjap_018016 [Stephania japonica]|uniref:Uncharacterized protein n=1 Tax=Stephania japonica TaxID=461633 RepID=A0AAP0I770_9MAGN
MACLQMWTAAQHPEDPAVKPGHAWSRKFAAKINYNQLNNSIKRKSETSYCVETLRMDKHEVLVHIGEEGLLGRVRVRGAPGSYWGRRPLGPSQGPTTLETKHLRQETHNKEWNGKPIIDHQDCHDDLLMISDIKIVPPRHRKARGTPYNSELFPCSTPDLHSVKHKNNEFQVVKRTRGERVRVSE